MVEKRKNISGIRFFHAFPGEKRGQGTCFEDLPEDKQNEVLEQLGTQGVKHLAKQLAQALINYHSFVGEFSELSK